MGTIHVNTDLMRELGQRFVECNLYMREQLIPQMQHITAQMEGDWVGASRYRYDELFNGWMQSSQSLVNWGTDIGNHVSQTANQLDNADRSL
jgi:WXG100 family type VII secretion target